MKRRLLHIYVIAVLVVIFGLSISIIWRVNAVRTSLFRDAIADFSQLSGDAAHLWQSEELPIAARRLTEILNGRETNRPIRVGIFAPGSEVDYVWVQNHLKTAPELDPELRHETDFRETRFSRMFQLPGGTNRIISAEYSIFDQREVFFVLRDTLIGALVLLTITLLVAVNHAIGSSRAYTGPAADDGVDAVEQQRPRTTPPPATPPHTTRLQPITQLIPRLTSEMERAAYTDTDISVAILQFDGVSHGTEVFRESCDAIYGFFPYKDLCFELDRDYLNIDSGAAVLVPNSPLQEALSLIERFQQFFWELRLGWGRPDADFHCGISARNGRLVEGERMLQESLGALRRSHGTAGRIIGFDPDPQKYRDYLTKS